MKLNGLLKVIVFGTASTALMGIVLNSNAIQPLFKPATSALFGKWLIFPFPKNGQLGYFSLLLMPTFLIRLLLCFSSLSFSETARQKAGEGINQKAGSVKGRTKNADK